MKYLSTFPHTARRVIATLAVASAAGLVITTAAFAASSSGTASGAALASQTARISSARVPPAGRASSASGSAWPSPTVRPEPSTTAELHQREPAVLLPARLPRRLRDRPQRSSARPPRRLVHQGGRAHVVVAPGATAHTILQYGDAEVSTAPGCDPSEHGRRAARLPADQYDATVAAFDLEVCSHAGPVYLRVEPILPGVGTING